VLLPRRQHAALIVIRDLRRLRMIDGDRLRPASGAAEKHAEEAHGVSSIGSGIEGLAERRERVRVVQLAPPWVDSGCSALDTCREIQEIHNT
jgi:hypothetical protein